MRLIFFSVIFFACASCSHLFYQGTPHQYVDPAQYKLVYEDVSFTSQDGTILHGWLFPAKGSVKGTVVHFHGNAQNISTHFLNLVWLTGHGFNYFIFDYRGFGKSRGTPTQATVHEDALAALAKAHEIREARGGGQLVVYGQSLGSVISLRALSDFDQSKVSLVVQDSPFYSYKKIAFDRLTSVWFMVPLAPLGFALVSDEFASWPVLSRIRVPTLVITGAKDEITPERYGRYIHKHVAAEKKWWWRSREATHINVYFTENGKYRQQLIELLAALKL